MTNSLPLLMTKLQAPPCRPQVVRRRRLTDQLDHALRRPVTLIVASAGFGKSTLVCHWSSPIDHPTAWLSLDEDDNDPTRFLVYLIAALRLSQPGLGETASALLTTPQAPPPKAILTVLLNELGSLPTPLTLILDDYHVIITPAIHEAMSFFVEHLPPQLHLIFTSRTDPPLPLARWRARNLLLELRTDDLRFTPEEASAFLIEAMGLSLSPSDVTALEQRTEGWITGLQLAALSLQGRSDPATFVKAFTGTHRYVLTYLTEEVLQRQPEALQTFLLQTSILERLSADLCDAVTGRSDSQAMLETLERANLFIIALDHEGVWYRYHALFVELLRHRLQRQMADQLPILHQRAESWYGQHGQIAEAIRHALTIPDFEQAAAWIEQVASRLWMRGEVGVLLGWLKALPLAIVHARPRLALAYAWVLTYTGPLDAIDAHLQAAEATLAAGGDVDLRAEIATIRTTVVSVQGDATHTIALCRQALQLMAPDNSYLRAMIMQALGFAYRVNGQMSEASQALTEAVALSRASNQLFWQIDALCNLGIVQVMQGQLRTANQTIQRALALVEAQGGDVLPIAGEVYGTWASLLHEWYELENAERQLEKSLALGEQGGNNDIVLSAHFMLARLRYTQGRQADALAAIAQAQQWAQHYKVTRIIRLLNAYQARFWLAYGDLEAAKRWAESYKSGQDQVPGNLQAIEELTLARLYFATGQSAVALSLLDQLVVTAQTSGRIGNVIQLLAFQSLIQRAQGRSEEAIATLSQALQLAEPEGYVCTFLDEGEAMKALLLEFRRLHSASALQATQDRLLVYANKLLAAFPALKETEHTAAPETPKIQNLLEPLSDRELEVLALIAAGLSNREIGAKLVIEVGTVKRHVTNIFGKLGAANRTQAVASGRQMGLL